MLQNLLDIKWLLIYVEMLVGRKKNTYYDISSNVVDENDKSPIPQCDAIDREWNAIFSF